jgi:hypothetical protein
VHGVHGPICLKSDDLLFSELFKGMLMLQGVERAEENREQGEALLADAQRQCREADARAAQLEALLQVLESHQAMHLRWP